MAIYSPPTNNAIQKTLGAQLLSGVTAAATLNNVVGIPNEPGVMVVDRVDSSGVSTPSLREYIAYTGTSGSTVTGLTRNADSGGTDQDHAVGAVVEFVFDVVQAKAIKDTFETEHNEDGTHAAATVTTLKASGAVVNTGTSDVTIVTPKALADSKVSLSDKTETLTNKTLTSPKINEDVALTATATELNALDGQMGAWTAWTPTITNITTTSGTFNCAYIQIGKTVHCRFSFTLGASSAMGTLPIIELPVTNKSGASIMVPVLIHDAGNTYYTGFAINDQGVSKLAIYMNKADGSYTEFTNITATVPMTWTTNDKLYFSCTYEAA